jgi:acyl-CoA reductase-like NAD-dependent aldehyde dehydrogenase
MPGTQQRSAMPSSTTRNPPSDLHDSPTARAIRATVRQAQRTHRAETVRVRQRAALLALLAKTMAELHISMAELNAARRALSRWKTPQGPDGP